ncbi:MAG: hypothetical protein WBL80_00135 [Erysipelotrichaceae bacterium]
MNSRTFNLGVPLAVIILGGWLVRFVDVYTKGSFFDTVVQLLIIAVLFYFGMRLNITKKRNDAWFKKLVITLVLALIVMVRIHASLPAIVPNILYWLALDGFTQSALIVYLGWQFFV